MIRPRLNLKLLKAVLILTASVTGIFLFNEYFIYYFVTWKCTWPETKLKENITMAANEQHKPLKVLVLSDPHLLGELNGFWLDKLRREWQMQRSYQTALHVHKPDVVFILGDMFDEGKWATAEQWNRYVRDSKQVFSTPKNIPVHVVVGNHDIGFHYDVTKNKLARFFRVFRHKNVHVLSILGINFVIINTMGFTGDSCFMCSATKQQLKEANKILSCAKTDQSLSKECQSPIYNISRSRPILLQHFPLYRESDELCNEIDSTPKDKIYKYVENYDVLSKSASTEILKLLKPRLVLSGHIHDACFYAHEDGTPEITVPSFSWRNRNNPSFYLIKFTSNKYYASKCFLPKETYIFMSYAIAVLILLFNIVGLWCRYFQRLSPQHFFIELVFIAFLIMGVNYFQL